MRRTVLSLLILPAMAALALAACGGSTRPKQTPLAPTTTVTTAANSGTTTTATTTTPNKPATPSVTIYSGLPLHGPRGGQGRAVAAGIRLAVDAHPRAGKLRIKYVSLNDTATTPTKKKARHPQYALSAWKAARNASKVAMDPSAVFYIGDLDSEATEQSLPPLNLAGIPQITPGSGYAALTSTKYAINPSRQQTLLRLVPDDSVEAKTILATLKSLGPACAHISIVSLPDAESSEIGTLVSQDATAKGSTFGVTPVGEPEVLKSEVKPSTSIAAYRETLKPGTVGCFVIAGHVDPTTLQLTDAIHKLVPGAYIVGSSGLCSSRWTNARDGGVSAEVADRLRCVSPILPLSHYSANPGFKRFESLYERRHPHRVPSTYTLYGYAAAELAIAAITQANRDGDGDNRGVLLSNVLDNAHDDVLGSYSFDIPTGVMTPAKYGIFAVGSNGDPQWVKTITSVPNL